MDLRARADDAELVRAAQAGDGQAFGVLFDRWSSRVLDVAYRIVRDREVAAEVAQDAFLAAWTGLERLEQAESFGGWVLRIGRNRALNRLERERRSVPLGDEETTEMVDRRTDHGDEAGEAAARAEGAELVWAAAAALGPRDASVLDLHLRHGLSPGEIAEELGVTANSAHQVLFRLRARLGDAVRACVLWRAGRPACPDLAGAVAAAGIEAFGPDAVRVIGAHAGGCDACAQRQEGRLSPEALFAAVPLLVVAPEVLAAIRLGLARAGVPVGDPPATAGGREPGSSDGSDAGGSDSASPPPEQTGVGAARGPAAVAVAAGVLVLVVVAVLLLLGDDGADPEEVATDGTTTSTTDGSSGSTTERPSASSSTSTSSLPPQGASSLPSPIPSSTTTTTGPSADIGTTSEPGFVPDTATPPRPTTPPTTASPPPTTAEPPAPDPPTIISFTATRIPGPGCATPSQRVALSWRTSGADDIRIVGPGAPSGPQAAVGTGQGCSPGPGTYMLTATGPGGTTNRTATA
ncbi:MAG TPA: sigma-70 family RNA polymerase sigma factor [Iamia sp.]|nr:sigma-70 family RNA polymerase sigma factor [Iamia sp.]